MIIKNYPFIMDLEKFTRYFIIKTVQVIVQSRISEGNYIRTECKPNGNDWFNLNITDLKEVSERTKTSLDNVFNENFSIKTNWRICCEISVRTNDDQKIVLETWILHNKVLDEATQKLKTHASPTKISYNNSFVDQCARLDTRIGLSATNTDSTSILTTNGITSIKENVQTASLKLQNEQSPDSLSSDGNNSITHKTSVRSARHSYGIKSSVSCSSLSAPSGPANCLTSVAPSTNSLAGHTRRGSSTTSLASSSPTSIYSIYNKMSLLLKTLMTTTRITPAYLTTNRGQSSNTHQVCYRIYGSRSPPSGASSTLVEDSTQDQNSESTSSLDLKDFVQEEELDRFSPLICLGSISSPHNELELVFCYRKDLRFSAKNTRKDCINLVQRHRNLFEEECASAARQLLANHYGSSPENKRDSISKCDNGLDNSFTDFEQPLSAAFASPDKAVGEFMNIEPSLQGLENAFDKLLIPSEFPNGTLAALGFTNTSGVDRELDISRPRDSCGETASNAQPIGSESATSPYQSKPVQIPFGPSMHNIGMSPTLSSAGGAPNSLSDSYVFVDLNPPFASDNQSDLNAFFHGPSPTFSSTCDGNKDVNKLKGQLEAIEANAELLDDFVDAICASEDDEEEDFFEGALLYGVRGQ